MDTADIALLRNLGPRSARVLRATGVRTIGELRALGPLEVYLRVLVEGGNVSLNLLWALVAGLRGESWLDLPEHEKRTLREQLVAALREKP